MFEHLPFRKTFYVPDGTFRDEIAEIIVSPMHSEWFYQLEEISQKSYLRSVRYFMEWFYKTKFKSTSKYNILNLYQEYRVNQCNIKSGNTGVNIIKLLMVENLNSNNSITKSVRTLCNLIIKRHRTLPIHNAKQPSLVSWFNDIPWLKFDMNEKDYSQLGKPRILSESFIFTISTILFEISEHKKKIKFASDSLNNKIRFEVL